MKITKAGGRNSRGSHCENGQSYNCRLASTDFFLICNKIAVNKLAFFKKNS